MDSAWLGFIGVFIGSALALVGQVVNLRYTNKKEESRWERERELEKERRVEEVQRRSRETAHADKEHLRTVYHNCIRYLSLMSSATALATTARNEAIRQSIEQTHEWLTLLSFHLRDTLNAKHDRFRELFRNFAEQPWNNRTAMRDLVIDLATEDTRLFPQELPRVEEARGAKSIGILIDDQYRRLQLQEGIEVARSVRFDHEYAKMTRGQREKLVETFFDRSKTMPASLDLYVPSFRANTGTIGFQESRWQAQLDPGTTAPSDIMAAWETAYDAAMLNATAQREEHASSSEGPV